MYNYLETMKEDIKNYIEDEIDLAEFAEDRYGLETFLYDTLWDNDSVTGNASGSYTFDRITAKENVEANLDLLREAYEDFGSGYEEIGRDWMDGNYEKMDVTIRCYLLGQAIAEVLDEMEI